jgi:DNA helicase-2/ATP-dependent DNA helicase PcrA
MSEVAQIVPLGLSPEQQRVVDHPIGVPATVDAGAGTGKTHTVVARVVALHNSGACPASKILLLTFARKAAAELRARVLRELGPGEEPPHCATFHSFAHDVLLDHAYDIGLSPDTVVLEEPDSRLIFRAAYDELVLGRLGVDPTAFPLRRVDDLVFGLFNAAVKLKQSAVTTAEFERRALDAGVRSHAVEYRELRYRYPKKYRGKEFRVDATIDDAQFAREARDYASRVRAAAALFRRFDELLRERTAMTYSDLLFRADVEVRRSAALRDELRRRYSHCIVDEYQDTDIAQHRFLQAVFGDALECVVAVGDVRQSIYAFRGAHPENMDAFATLPGCVPYRLTQSRRSRQKILDFAHHVIADDRGDAEPLTAHRGDAGVPIVHVASLWTEDGVARNAAEQRAEEAEWLAAQIQSRLSRGDLRPRDLAVLLRYKTNSMIYTDALLRAGIPFQLTGGVGFYDAPEVLDALAWLRLLVDPLHSIAAARVLQSSVFGVNDADVVALSAGSEWADPTAFARRVFVEPLNEAVSADGRARVMRLRDTLDALEQFAGQSLNAALPAVLDRAGLRLYHEQSDDRRAPQALANLRKLEQLAVAFAQRMRGATAREFVGYIDELEQTAGDEREADASDLDAVVVTTIHNAKGLEWPVVFVADVWPRNNRSEVLSLDTDGALLCSEGGDGRVPFHVNARRWGADASGMVRQAGDPDASDAADREERRLFYVALTRARDELFISGKRAKPSKANPKGAVHAYLGQAYAWLREVGWPSDEPLSPVQLAAGVGESATAGGDATTSREQLSAARERLAWIRDAQSRPVRSLAQALSFSLIRRFEQCPRAVAYAAKLGIPRLAGGGVPIIDPEWQTGAARDPDSLLGLGAFGDLVHRALELWAGRICGANEDRGADPQCGADLYGRPTPVESPLPAPEAISLAARDLGETPSKSDLRRAADAFTLMTGALAGWTPLYAEAPFTLDVDGTTVSGFIDLIARDPAGGAMVVDYKTGVAPAEDYALQLALYREAARAAYGVDAGAVLARVRDGAVLFESAPELDRGAVAARVRAAALGIANGDDTPQPGPWCATCAYRAAPCMSFPRS